MTSAALYLCGVQEKARVCSDGDETPGATQRGSFKTCFRTESVCRGLQRAERYLLDFIEELMSKMDYLDVQGLIFCKLKTLFIGR